MIFTTEKHGNTLMYKKGEENMQDWLEWQRKVIREEYVEGERYEKAVRGRENDQNTGRRKTASP